MVHEMRRRGIRIDQSAAEQARDYCLQKRDAALAELSEQLGTPVSMDEIASQKWKVRTFDAHGIDYPRTEKGNPSFKGGKLGWMAHASALVAAADRDRKQVRPRRQHISRRPHPGAPDRRAHLCVKSTRIRSEDGGTRSFRFSYSNPPLQQMPSRDEELAPLIRRVFLPEEGEMWCTVDVSQQEFRFIVHYAVMRRVYQRRRRRPSATAPTPTRTFMQLAARWTGLERKDRRRTSTSPRLYGAGVREVRRR